MRALLLIAFGAFIASSSARSSRTSREVHDDHKKSVAHKYVHAMNLLRDATLYDNMTKALEKSNDELKTMIISSFFESFHIPTEKAHRFEIQHGAREALLVVIKLLKTVLVKGSHPTDEEIDKLAVDLSHAAKSVHVNHRPFGTAEDVHLNDKNVETIAEIASTHVHSVDPKVNNFISALHTKNEKLYKLAGWTKCIEQKFRESLLKVYEGEHPDPVATFGPCVKEWGSHIEVVYEFLLTELFEALRSEESAKTLIKGFAAVCNALKHSSSYESWDTLIASLDKAPRVHAHAVFWREVYRCSVKKYKPESQEKVKKGMKALLSLLKVMLAEDALNVDALIEAEKEVEHASTHGELDEETKQIFYSLTFYDECVITPEDRKLFREVVDHAHGELADEAKLNQVKAKSEKIYSVLYLINSHITMLRRRDGLSHAAEEFFHKTVTFPNALHLIQRYAKTTDEYRHKSEEAAQKLVTDFHALPADVRKELVKRFPFRSVFLFSVLD